ncbi:PEP-CTERM motif protein [Amantichitinum ursilacus]|uniref:PEP-CTERM motif protein n=2 Tax=Amantichitinum ursilacus TaxID=857265 RepID=A0A0N0GR72_9NEIS|nr:PEP-CTERM motif protein [Amantichitinum ursilacus]
MRLAKTHWAAAAALLLTFAAPSHAAVQLSYPGFNLYFGYGVTADASSGTLTTSSGLTGDYGGYQYHYDKTTVSGITYTARDQSSTGALYTQYSLAWLADSGWQLSSFTNVTTGLVTGATSWASGSFVSVTGATTVGKDTVTVSPRQGGQSSSWTESYNNTIASDPSQAGWVGTNWSGGSRFDGYGNGNVPVVATDINGIASFTAYRFYDPIPTAAVPEPETWAMLGMGLVGVVAAKRRRDPQSPRA